MAVTWQQSIAQFYGSSGTATSGSFTPAAGGNQLILMSCDGESASKTLTFTGSVGSYSQLTPPGNLADTNEQTTDGVAWNSSATSGAQTATVSSTAPGTKSMVGWGWEYSGATTSSGAGNLVSLPGTGTGAILGTSVTVPSGGILLAMCLDTAGGSTVPTSPSGTNRGSGSLHNLPWCATEYSGTGAAIQPSFTSAAGATDKFVVLQILLSPASGTSPTVTSVNGGSAITEGTPAVPFVGTNFASGLTCAIEQYLSGTLDATVTQSNPVYTDATDGKFDLTMEPAGTQLAFTDAIYTHKLKVTVGANSGDGSIAGGLTPPAGLIFKTLTSYNSGSAYVITASGTLVVNDQLEASGNATGTTAAPAGLSINADGTWSYANGYTVQNFYVRAYDSTTQTWGAWALQSTSTSPTSVLYKNVYVVNTTGLVQWVHYIPIKYVTVTATEVNRFDDNGAIGVNVLTSVTGLAAWVDYTPVAVSAGTHPWRYDDDGYIPVMQMN